MTDIGQMKDLLGELTASSNQAYDAPFETILTLQRQCQKYHELMVEIDGADESNWTFLQLVKERELRERIVAIAERLGCVGVAFSEDFRASSIVSLILKSERTNRMDNEGWGVPY